MSEHSGKGSGLAWSKARQRGTWAVLEHELRHFVLDGRLGFIDQ